MKVPVNEPVISDLSKKNVIEALETGWISSSGRFVDQFERDFANYVGVKHGIAVCNGTAALHVALLAMGIGKGDEVIVPAFTMAASWLSIIHAGAKPVFVDCELETYNIDVKKIEEKITDQTKAIMPVHIYGLSCEMDELLKIASKYKIKIIEDAAEVHGAEYKGKKCGSFGDAAAFSFYANKIITTGEGGMVVTDDDEIAHKSRKLKDLYHSDEKRFIHEDVGYNYRMTNMQAAVGCGELAGIDGYIEKKQWMASLYDENLKNVRGLKLPVTKSHLKNVYWMYGVVVDENEFGMSKDELRNRLKEKGVDTRDFFYSPTDQPVLRKYLQVNESFPNADYLAHNGFYMPSGLAITEDQILYVCDVLKSLKGS
ncbi:DegT/DnrJ/EryC1/StrS family aminotransferase [bacterium]|nr:DegT/DnrJ/EryC1/StrS family aminotransferase [bacterium]